MIPEIDIRQEVIDMITGKDFGEEHFQPMIHRQVRKDTKLNSIKCTCWDKISKEGRIGCSDCEGVGYLWDEHLIRGFPYFITTKNMIRGMDYPAEAGRSEKHELGFITMYADVVTKGDRVFAALMSDSGAIQYPLIVHEEYYVINNRKYRLDHGKAEFNMSVLSRVS